MPEAHLPPEETSSEPERPETILLVEDDPVQVKLVQTMLQDAGYATHCAQDGRGCLKLVADLLPDIILMDVVMPHLNGIETCRHLKSDERFRRIPVIFVTGYTDEETLQAAFAAGGKEAGWNCWPAYAQHCPKIGCCESWPRKKNSRRPWNWREASAMNSTSRFSMCWERFN